MHFNHQRHWFRMSKGRTPPGQIIQYSKWPAPIFSSQLCFGNDTHLSQPSATDWSNHRYCGEATECCLCVSEDNTREEKDPNDWTSGSLFSQFAIWNFLLAWICPMLFERCCFHVCRTAVATFSHTAIEYISYITVFLLSCMYMNRILTEFSLRSTTLLSVTRLPNNNALTL